LLFQSISLRMAAQSPSFVVRQERQAGLEDHRSRCRACPRAGRAVAFTGGCKAALLDVRIQPVDFRFHQPPCRGQYLWKWREPAQPCDDWLSTSASAVRRNLRTRDRPWGVVGILCPICWSLRKPAERFALTPICGRPDCPDCTVGGLSQAGLTRLSISCDRPAFLFETWHSGELGPLQIRNQYRQPCHSSV
jgi:hypothetical protein